MIENDGQGGKATQGVDDAESFHAAIFLPAVVLFLIRSQSKETAMGTTNPMTKDAVAAADDARHEAALRTIEYGFAKLVDVGQIAEALSKPHIGSAKRRGG